MGKIIYFVENEKRHGVIRFVKSYRKGSWFRKERIEYCLTIKGSRTFSKDDIEMVRARIRKDYPDAKIDSAEPNAFMEKHEKNRFWVIAMWNNHEQVFYDGTDMNGKPTYTSDLEEVRMVLSLSCAEETLRTIQQTTRDRVWVMPVYLDLTNELLTPVMMITCTTKRSNQETKYLARVEGNRLRLVNTSAAAQKFSYEDVMNMYMYLVTHNKNFMYAVLPAFKDNVNFRDIESYMRENNVSRMVVMDLQLKFLNYRNRNHEDN